MSTVQQSPEAQITSAVRIGLGLLGLVALAVGIAILVWPGHSAAVVTGIFAFYAIVVGIVYAAVAVFSRGRGAWSRIGFLVLAALFVAAGVIAFANLEATTVFLVTFVAIALGVLWIIEGIVSFFALKSSPSKGWTIFFAILSIVAGLVLVTSPLWSAVILWLFIGLSLVVLGIVQVVRAISFGRRTV